MNGIQRINVKFSVSKHSGSVEQLSWLNTEDIGRKCSFIIKSCYRSKNTTSLCCRNPENSHFLLSNSQVTNKEWMNFSFFCYTWYYWWFIR